MAAHDLDVYFPYDAGAGSNTLESQWRQMARWWLTSGPVRGELSDFTPSTTSGRNIIVGAGRCWVNGASGELSSAFTQPFGTNTSGNPRIDRVVLRNDFSANKIVLDVLVGTPGASPVAPALTQNSSQWEVSICQVTLASGYSTISAGNILDDRTFAQGRPPGGPVVQGCAINLSAAQSVPASTWTGIVFDDVDEYDTCAMHTVGEQRVTMPPGERGLWVAKCSVRWAVDTTGDRSLRIVVNGVAFKTFGSVKPSAEATGHSGNLDLVLNVGDIVTWEAWQSTSGAINITASRASYRYQGPVA